MSSRFKDWTTASAKTVIADLDSEVKIKPPAKVKKKVSRPKGRHLTREGKAEFCDLCARSGLPRPVAEYQPFLDEGRKHSVDFYFEAHGLKLALEVEGWGHRTNVRFKEDTWKYNSLALRRIYLLRCPPKNLYSPDTINTIKKFFT